MEVQIFPLSLRLRGLKVVTQASHAWNGGSIPLGGALATYSSGLRGQPAKLLFTGSTPAVVLPVLLIRFKEF